MVADWGSIIKYYQMTSHLPRYDAEMWEKIRHHSREMLVLIPEIRQHPELQNLHAHIELVALCLVNLETNRVAEVLIRYNDVEITLFKVGEGLDSAKHKKIKASMSNAIEVLAENLLDN